MAVYVGIDVSQDRLDVGVADEAQSWWVGNDAAGIEELRERLLALAPQGVVLEATGGLESAVAGELVAAGLEVTVVNPRQVRDRAPRDGWRRRTR